VLANNPLDRPIFRRRAHAASQTHTVELLQTISTFRFSKRANRHIVGSQNDLILSIAWVPEGRLTAVVAAYGF
jgi:hypothetical protein